MLVHRSFATWPRACWARTLAAVMAPCGCRRQLAADKSRKRRQGDLQTDVNGAENGRQGAASVCVSRARTGVAFSHAPARLVDWRQQHKQLVGRLRERERTIKSLYFSQLISLLHRPSSTNHSASAVLRHENPEKYKQETARAFANVAIVRRGEQANKSLCKRRDYKRKSANLPSLDRLEEIARRRRDKRTACLDSRNSYCDET